MFTANSFILRLVSIVYKCDKIKKNYLLKNKLKLFEGN